MMRRLALVLCLLLPVPASAQDGKTLADIRQELSILLIELRELETELSTTRAPNMDLSGTSALDRIDAMEAQLRRLTARTEEMEHRIESVVSDGTNRIGDLQFRVCELDPGCDIGDLDGTPILGGEGAAAPAPTPAPEPPAETGGAQLAIGEREDFDAAKAAFDSGNFRSAAKLFATFTQTYTGGPLNGQAHFYRGKALSELGEDPEAARAYLESFSGSPDGPKAPEALLALGLKLDELGQRPDACVTLGQVTTRYPESGASVEAQAARAEMACG